ncbi:hypothetical protein PIROE2DRAFT_63897 [Piromyces sp. E2]|nr:hypothetical protein PIROE2DRAFT_63897 [Piromyces sp. E2]|eukprot:OUM59259.1 hypothetical protein PIROE2DRAFT_63897 [Piromyces sp. E2]
MINNSTFSVCNGDGDDSSLILFDSGEVEKKYEFLNLSINNSITNGPLVKIIGNNNNESIITFENINISNSINKNKQSCGIINFQKNISLKINYSNFTDNQSLGNGGAICFENISNMELNLGSNIFQNNKAENGGAIYFNKETNMDNEYNDTINIDNNTFNGNKAVYFGGAIYSKYQKLGFATVNNNKFTYNEAGFFGGGVYSPNSIHKTLFDVSKVEFKNNSVNSFIDNYSSKPSYILMNSNNYNKTISVNTGEYIPLKFSLYDEFDNIVTDITKYYSMMTLKLEVDKVDVIYLLGNTGSFINEIEIKECNENQIKMIDKSGIQYCVNPTCKESCLINESAICKPYYKENINDINLNICECLPGWKGNNCEEKIYIDYR